MTENERALQAAPTGPTCQADDWRKRAVLAEAEVRSLQTALAALKARDIRICLHCGRVQEGVK